MDLLADTGRALDPSPPIENFEVVFRSPTEAEISYTVAEREIVNIIDMDVDYTDMEPESRDSPGWPAAAEINQLFGLDIAERYEWEKYWEGKDKKV